MSQRFVFKRPTLAAAMIAGLAGEGLADYSSGLFLAAPRRTGKSTFLREDLVPACTDRGWLAVYLDLWTNKQADPAALIEAAVARALQQYEGKLKKLLKTAGVEKISILRTVTWDFSKDRFPAGATLADALQLLSVVSGQMVVLIIDEAQHALETEAGLNAMFGLKAARDAMNQGDTPGELRLVLTGSSRDKLAQLVLGRQQPFYGASVTPFPLLGDDFVEAFTSDVNAKLAPGNTFNADDMKRAFELVGRRPELLRSIVEQVALQLGSAPSLGQLLEQGAAEVQTGVWVEYESAYFPLSPVQKAILLGMSESTLAKVPFSAYSESTLARIGDIVRLLGGDGAVTAQSVQAGLEALREKGLVWRAGRGAYALEDRSMADWLVRQ